jgi:O-succinylbenzoate synthase
MKIWIHRYRLEPIEPKNKAREGALIKTEWVTGQVGYSDLHPWPEFGEAELKDHLEALAALRFTPLVESAMEFNYLDREYRLRKRNAFLGLILPRSHRLVFDIETLQPAQLRQWSEQGFTHVKVKLGRNLKAESEILINMICSTTLEWRLDFNGRISAAEFADWWVRLDPAVKSRIDFVEDPCGEGVLKIAGPWADDWKKQPRAQIRIVKPARETNDEIAQYDRVIFTHSLDHPLGQAMALWTAARFYSEHPRKMEVCGVAGNEFFARDEFSRAWFCEGPRMKPTIGTGFGFDEILAGLEWEPLL